MSTYHLASRDFAHCLPEKDDFAHFLPETGDFTHVLPETDDFAYSPCHDQTYRDWFDFANDGYRYFVNLIVIVLTLTVSEIIRFK